MLRVTIFVLNCCVVVYASDFRSGSVYAYKLVDAGFIISGIIFPAGLILFKDKLIFWWSCIVVGRFRVFIIPVDSVYEYISLCDTCKWLTEVV